MFLRLREKLKGDTAILTRVPGHFYILYTSITFEYKKKKYVSSVFFFFNGNLKTLRMETNSYIQRV